MLELSWNTAAMQGIWNGLASYSSQWVDFWSIVGALATAAAVIVALAAVHHERRRAQRAEDQLKEERRSARDAAAEEAEAARRAQALLVTAWPQWEIFTHAPRPGVGRWNIKVGNFSDAPVFNVVLQAFTGINMLDAEGGARVLEPNGRATITTTHTNDLDPPRALVYFRDLAGVWWRRQQTGGALEEVAESAVPTVSFE